ncbi:hypothetical protein MIMGU_mgv1a025697mg [Erythranthe guttata]|uniref:Protein kinase domain-containing protein n=1 Tax=Erythranthe guttata TaxID=4155 RepID=A0A022Q1V1_ERYGU|nr:hypothetical protein MIMGU_mgv1a025697mg [Erythranthe guttata]
MEKERKKYPIGAEYYTLYEEVGTGASASVHRALCTPLNEVVAIKILDFERDKCDLNNVSREAQTMVLVDHPNVLKSHCSFVSDHNLWVVMPYMAGGSCLHILKATHPDGFEEVVIATILREVLKGLEYLHQHGHIHRDVKAGNVLIDTRGGIKLGDFGVSAYLFDAGDRQRMRNTFVGTPCWMAPEVMEQLHGYDFKADIWSFGITALELAHGHAPFSKYPPMKVLLMTLQNAPPGLDYERDKKFSKSFKQMIASCLVKDPSKRPSAKKLLRNSFFKQARSNDYISRTLLEGLPALGDRLQALKRKEEDMLAQKKMPDGQKEEISQNEYKRGISGWNFNLEDMKAQALLSQSLLHAGPTNLQSIDSQSDIISKVNGEEVDEKAKNPVVQQKGRFKVTSENVDMEKAAPAPILQKSHSVQVMAQLPGISSPLTSEAAPANSPGQGLFYPLQSVLNTNILQRETILFLMKQVVLGEASGSTGTLNTEMAEKSLLETAHEREKELLREISDLQCRLLITQEELQKYKSIHGELSNLTHF